MIRKNAEDFIKEELDSLVTSYENSDYTIVECKEKSVVFFDTIENSFFEVFIDIKPLKISFSEGSFVDD